MVRIYLIDSITFEFISEKNKRDVPDFFLQCLTVCVYLCKSSAALEQFLSGRKC